MNLFNTKLTQRIRGGSTTMRYTNPRLYFYFLTQRTLVSHIRLAEHHDAITMRVEPLAHHAVRTQSVADDRSIFGELVAYRTRQHFRRRPRPHRTKLRPQLPVTSLLLAQLTLSLHNKVAQIVMMKMSIYQASIANHRLHGPVEKS